MHNGVAVVKQRLGDLLIKANLIDDIQLRVALKAQKDSGERLGTTLVELGFVDETVLAAFLSKQADMPCINISNIHIPANIVRLVPKEVALEHHVVPIRRAGDTLYLAMADPFNDGIIESVRKALPDGMSLTPMIAPEVSLKKCLLRHYEPEKLAADAETEGLLSLVDEIDADMIQSLATQVRSLSEQVEIITDKLDALTTLVADLRAFLMTRAEDPQDTTRQN